MDKSMVLKLPPPPPIANGDPAFNRWLLELTSILSAAGGIDPASIPGLAGAIAGTAANTAAITAINLSLGLLSAQLNTQQLAITALQASVVTINGQLTTLGARGELLFGAGAPAAGLGKVNDWYGDTAGAAGSRVWIKKAVGVWTAFPF